MIVSAPLPHRPSLLGVLYAEDFDDEGAGPVTEDAGAAPEPEVIEPVFTTSELEAARAEARQAGRAEAEHGLSASRNRLLALLVDGMSEARAGASAAAEAGAEGVARTMLGALAACLPQLCQHHGAAELRALVRTLLPALSEEPRVMIRVNPHMLPAMQAEIAMLDAEVAERVHVLPTDAVEPGDARVTWADGSAVRDTARARAAFAEGLASLGLLQREYADV